MQGTVTSPFDFSIETSTAAPVGIPSAKIVFSIKRGDVLRFEEREIYNSAQPIAFINLYVGEMGIAFSKECFLKLFMSND